jgi:transposase-like protein
VSETKPRYWSKLIAEQEASGQKVLPFCRERGITEPSFYYWRKRLRKSTPVRFALLETPPADTGSTASALELVLKSGERLRIGNQVEAAALRMVLEAVRG